MRIGATLTLAVTVVLSSVAGCGMSRDGQIGCGSDAECGDGAYCTSAGICRKVAAEPASGCTNDSGCADGELCQSGECVAAEVPVDPTCAADQDCPFGKLCDTATSACVACLADEHCDTGLVCHDDHTCGAPPAACTSDDACGALLCDVASGACVECLAGGDCAPGESCLDHACVVPPSIGCARAADCNASETCAAGQCVAAPPAPAGAGLVINEVDYDNVNSDTNEFVELYNGTGASVSLSGLALVFVNGGMAPPSEYLRVELGAAGTLTAGAYLVVASTTVSVAAGALRLDLPYASDNIQNGSTDGIAFVDLANNQLLDALSYEGAMDYVSITGMGSVSLVEGAGLITGDSNSAQGALVRRPNGADTNDAAADWTFGTAPTPGAANVP